MRIGFRQGLLSFQRDAGTPVYLQPSSTPNFISHVVSPTPTIAAFAHGASDYLLKFDTAVPVAWGPIIADLTNHLYWDIDLLTATVSRGITFLDPIYSGSEPVAPANDQHWMNTSDGVMRVWSVSKNKWLERVRLFAGRVMNGNINAIVMFTEGSQAGLTTPSNPGFIMLDTMLQPLRKASQNGEFLTDDDATRVLSTVGTAGVLVQPVSRVTPVRAGETIPRMSLVYFSADDTVRLASSNPALIPTRPPVGIMIDGLVGGEIGSLVQSGELSYDQWDFSGNAGKPVYCDSNGQITLTRPAGLMAYRVGFVKNARTLLMMVDAETNPQVYTATIDQLLISGDVPVQISDVTNGLGERVVTISVPDVTALQAGLMTSVQRQTLIDHGTQLSTAEGDIGSLELNKADVGHSHLISDVTSLQGALDNKSDILHNHDLVYSAIGHNHDLVYAPLTHAHLVGDVTGLQTALDQKTFRAHLNAFSEVFTSVDRSGAFDVGVGADLVSALSGKSDTGHVHAISGVTGLQDVLDGKSDTGHVHAISGVTGLQLALDGKASTLHAHLIGDITELQTALDGKSYTTHTHALDDLSDVDLTTTPPNPNEVLSFNGVAWVPAPLVTPPFVKVWGGMGNLTQVPRVSADPIWASMALPVLDAITHPSGTAVDHLPNVYAPGFLAPTFTPTADVGQTLITVRDNGQYLVGIKARVTITFNNPADEVRGFIRISAYQSTGDNAENTTGNRFLGYLDITDPFSAAQRAAGFSGSATQTVVDISPVFSAGLYYSDIEFRIANFLEDAPGNIGASPTVDVQDMFIRIVKLQDATYSPPI